MASTFDSLSSLYSALHHSHVAREEIIKFQNKQLRRLITHAYQNVGYYHKLFDEAGLQPDDIQNANDLVKLPLTSKKNLQMLPEKELIDRNLNHEQLIVRMTSGSSGEPFKIRRTWLEDRIIGQIRLRTMKYFGLKIFDRTASVGLVRPTHPRDKQLPAQIVNALGIYRKSRINCLSPPETILNDLRQFRPNVLTGLPGVLSLLAQTILKNDEPAIRPGFVRLNGEVVTPLMRLQMIEAFKCQIFDLYGSHEFSPIAWECKETGEYHTCDDGIILEVVKDGRPAAPGERGEVVITNLHSLAMPLIRYKLGDIVTKGLETCRCGQPFSTIRSIQGRMIDYFELPGGRLIHPYEILYKILVDHSASWIRQYELIQEQKDKILLRVVPSISPRSEDVRRLEHSVTDMIGARIEFRIVVVPEIRMEPNGKFRVSRSLVKSAYDGIDWNREETIQP